MLGQADDVLITGTGELALDVVFRWCRHEPPRGPIICGPPEELKLFVFVGVLPPAHAALLRGADLLIGGAHAWNGLIPSSLAALVLWAPRLEPPEPWRYGAPHWVQFRQPDVDPLDLDAFRVRGQPLPAAALPAPLDLDGQRASLGRPSAPPVRMDLDLVGPQREALPPGTARGGARPALPRPQASRERPSPPRSRSPPRRAERPHEDDRRGRPNWRSRSPSHSSRPDRPRSGGGAGDDRRGQPSHREVRYRGEDTPPAPEPPPHRYRGEDRRPAEPPPPPCQWKAGCVGRWLLDPTDGVSRRCELSHPFVIPDVLRGLLYRLQPAESRWLTPEGSTKLVEFQAIDKRAADTAAAAARAAAAQAARPVASRASWGPKRASAAPPPAAAPAAAGAVYSASQSAALIREANAIILAEETAGPPTSSTFTFGEEALVGRARGRRASPWGGLRRRRCAVGRGLFRGPR